MRSINNTLFVGKVLHELTECPSTNTYAKELVSKNRPTEGTAIFTSNQTQGRGQFGKVWDSEPWKNIACSIVLYPAFVSVPHQFDLNQAISLGVRAFCQEHTGRPAQIKWPNDIYIQHRKIGGILIENHIQQNRIESSIVGIGINVNQTEFPEHLPNPVSMKQLSQKHLDIGALLPSLFTHIEQHYLRLKAGDKGNLRNTYRNALYLYEQSGIFKAESGRFEGKIKNVDQQGRLVISTSLGTKSYSTGEVEWLS